MWPNRSSSSTPDRARRPRRHPRRLPRHHQRPHQPPRTLRSVIPRTRREPGLRGVLPARRRRPRRPHPGPPRRVGRNPAARRPTRPAGRAGRRSRSSRAGPQPPNAVPHLAGHDRPGRPPPLPGRRRRRLRGRPGQRHDRLAGLADPGRPPAGPRRGRHRQPHRARRAARGRGFDDADDVAAVLHWRLAAPKPTPVSSSATPSANSPRPVPPANSRRAIAQIAAAMDARSPPARPPSTNRTAGLGSQTRPPPRQPDAKPWRQRAGIVAGYQETFGLDPTRRRPDRRPCRHRSPRRPRPGGSEPRPPSTAPTRPRWPSSPTSNSKPSSNKPAMPSRTAPAAVADQLRDATRQLRQTRTAHGLAIRSARPCPRTDSRRPARSPQPCRGAPRRSPPATPTMDIDLLAPPPASRQCPRRARHPPQRTSRPAERRRQPGRPPTPPQPRPRPTAKHASHRRSTSTASPTNAQLAHATRSRTGLAPRQSARRRPNPQASHYRTTTQPTASTTVAKRSTHPAGITHSLRGRRRATLNAELDELVTLHPEHPNQNNAASAGDMLLDQAHNTDTDRTSILREQLNTSPRRRHRHTGLAERAGQERDARASIYDKLASQITRRSAINGAASGARSADCCQPPPRLQPKLLT